MPSPFPGMDPYLEGRLWPDVHNALIYTIRSALAAALPPGFFANIDEYVWLSADPGDRGRRVKPDGLVTDRGQRTPAPAAPAIAVAEPTVRVTLPAAAVERKQYLRVVDAADRVVTVVEVLSPSDELPKADRVNYPAKRDGYLAAGANLVEIDLLRRGHRPPTGEPELPDADYVIFVSRADEFPAAGVWAFTVRDPIPVVPVPLTPDLAAIPLSVRDCLDRAYDDARYDRKVDYAQPPVPPLRRPDAEWAADLLAGRPGGGIPG